MPIAQTSVQNTFREVTKFSGAAALMHVSPGVTDPVFGPIPDPQTSARMTLSSLVTCFNAVFLITLLFFFIYCSALRPTLP